MIWFFGLLIKAYVIFLKNRILNFVYQGKIAQVEKSSFIIYAFITADLFVIIGS